MKTVGMRLLAATLIAVALSACSLGGGTRSGGLPTAVSQPESKVSLTPTNELPIIATNLAAQQRSDGAILYTSTMISPYFANTAAIGAVHGGVDLINVQQWMSWYVAHSTLPNPWSLPGVITDYNVASNGSISSTGTADSVDSYAATFISLAAAAWREGSPQLRSYVASLQTSLDLIASAIDAVSDSDGLTWATPTYKMKYVMDNSEVYQGLVDLAFLRSQVYGDVAGAAAAAAHAAQIQAAIGTKLWSASRSQYAVALDDSGNLTWPQRGNWEDATTQLFPVLHGVIAATSSPAQIAYNKLSTEFPNWPSLKKPDEYPWVSIAFVALQMNDLTRASTYASAIQKKYSPGFAYPWYCAESGWYIRFLMGLTAPSTVADL
jgi:hypothetical protein